MAVAGCVALALVIWWSYRSEFHSAPFVTGASLFTEYGGRQTEGPRRAFLLLVPTVIAFFLSSVLGIGLPLIALTAGAAVLLTSRVRPSEILRGVDWVLLLFFAGLFVVIGGARHAEVLDALLKPISVTPGLGSIVSLHLVSAAVSQVVSNVPLTMLVIPLIERVTGEVLWISLAAGATLGGNATIIGAVANIIVVETAAREGVTVSFREFLRVGMVVTPITLVISMGILALEWALGVLS